MEFKVLLLLMISCLISIAGGYFTWKYADFFLARRDYYVSSKFDILKKKLSMSLGVAGAIMFLTIMVTSMIADKNKIQIKKQEIKIKKKNKK